ncbi:hypothetical protein O4J56_08740 [Nocardiopsis sp. RSe5-2]|uniref:DUF3592 domain-containing protein n=1 Tax=Nocardiopsis endophytica TaxID=3018445 RepID=A0ABT4U192_9ACTN|nr:hypothetical protein [Nocardiopsis endophytica]MDA2810718.1 hypothetical protein [Nocardiopsis endophytica]
MPPSPLAVLTALALLLVGGTVVAAVLLRRRVLRERAEEWSRFQRARAAHPDARVFEVVEVYQNARSGTKAIIEWHGTQGRQDAWFDGFFLPPGALALVTGRTGYGPHNDDPAVFYVRWDQVHTWVRPEVRAAP